LVYSLKANRECLLRVFSIVNPKFRGFFGICLVRFDFMDTDAVSGIPDRKRIEGADEVAILLEVVCDRLVVTAGTLHSMTTFTSPGCALTSSDRAARPVRVWGMSIGFTTISLRWSNTDTVLLPFETSIPTAYISFVSCHHDFCNGRTILYPLPILSVW
jgi:hypothetical protein